MTHRPVLPILALLIFSARPALPDELTKEKKANIERLLEVTHALAVGTQLSDVIVAQTVQGMKAANPNVPDKVVQIVTDEVKATIRDNLASLQEEIVLIHHKHFTSDEISALLAFYGTPVGKKAADLMPVLATEAVAAGSRWGESLQPVLRDRLIKRLQKEMPESK